MHCTFFILILFFGLLAIVDSLPAPVKEASNKADDTLVSSSSTITVAPTHTTPSTCATYYPTVLRQLVEAQPDTMQVNTAKSTKSFHVAQSVSLTDKVKFDRVHQYVVFNSVAAASWGCQLMASWPDVSGGGNLASAPVSLDVYSASYNSTAYAEISKPKGAKIGTPDNGPFATWASMTKATTVKGSGGGKGGGGKGLSDEQGDRTEDDVHVAAARLTYFGTVAVNPGEHGVTVNSEACPAGNRTLEFLFEIPGTDGRDASVQFLGSRDKGAGIYLIANC